MSESLVGSGSGASAFIESVKTDLANTVASYFAPVKAVVGEVSRAVYGPESALSKIQRTDRQPPR